MILTDQEIKFIKARAFDDLMKVMNGRHYQVDHYRRPKPTRIPSFGDACAEATMQVEDIYIYEWKIRVANHTDLERLCPDNARKNLESEEKDANSAQPGL